MSPSLKALCTAGGAAAMLLTAAACSPTVKLEAPSEPIRFDVNVNITQEVRVKIDRELQQTFAANPALFGLGADAPTTPPDQPHEPEN